MLLKTQGEFGKRTQNELKTNPKRTQNEARFEREMHSLNPKSELSQARVRAGGSRLEMRKGTEAIRSRKPGASREKHKNSTNEASILLKTHGAFGKRTQNELKNEPRLEQLMRELMPNSEVARLDGKKPLTRLATIATLPDFWGFDGPIRIGAEIGLPREEGC